MHHTPKKFLWRLFVLLAVALATLDGYSSSLSATVDPQSHTSINPPPISFTENKGQVRDQNDQSRNDVLFGGSSGNVVFHLRANGISYQLYKKSGDNASSTVVQWTKRPEIKSMSINRIDLDWLNSNPRPGVVSERPTAGLSNYYLPNCGDGILGVKSYEQVLYKNVYRGIDLKWYQQNGNLKYDYLVAAGADHKQILLEIKGAEKISVNGHGQLVIQTSLGNIVEDAPLVLQKGKILEVKWQISSDNRISFEIKGINHAQPFVIDPAVRTWGTYYGGAGAEDGMKNALDAAGNLYLTGYTDTGTGTVIATTGAYQATIAAMLDAFLLKMDANGVRQWATYYGGNLSEWGAGCAIDASGNVYMAGRSASTVGISTSGSHQVNNLGGHDGYLVKFNSSGVRQWATYYGGEKADEVYGCAVDPSGNVYICGVTDSYSLNSISTPGSHQPVYGGGTISGGDAFLVKFNSVGSRLWATYYGGTGNDDGYNCTTDALGNVYLVGTTTFYTGTAIASAVSHQSAYGGGMSDAYLVKFNASGQRQWGTYYGGSLEDYGYDCVVNVSGDIYFSGSTTSTNTGVISTPGAHQLTYGGGNFEDAVLVKFNSSGTRQWGTYYGGLGTEIAYSCVLDGWGNIFIAGVVGNTTSSIIATPGSHQTLHGGNFDGYLVKFTPAGVRVWGSFYGGSNSDAVRDLAIDATGNLYICGYTESSNGTSIATSASHQTTFAGGAGDAFVAKFYDCDGPPVPTDVTPLGNLTYCGSNTTTLTVTGTGTINWFNVAAGGSVISSGSVFITPSLSPGSYTYYAAALTCTSSTTRLPITVNVHGLPIVHVLSNSNLVICAGEEVVLVATGAQTYNWNPGGQSGNTIFVTPATTTDYTVTGTDQNGCSSIYIFQQQVELCTGLTSLTDHETVNVYPNPNQGVFTLQQNSVRQNRNIKIFNALGQLVFYEDLDKSTNTIDTRLTKGIYSYVLSSGTEALKAGKIVVE